MFSLMSNCLFSSNLIFNWPFAKFGLNILHFAFELFKSLISINQTNQLAHQPTVNSSHHIFHQYTKLNEIFIQMCDIVGSKRTKRSITKVENICKSSSNCVVFVVVFILWLLSSLLVLLLKSVLHFSRPKKHFFVVRLLIREH